MGHIIEVSNFTKKYGDFAAVNDISFTVEEGTIFGFLGPNGAGKSTTINTLCTILDKTEGNLIINGFDVAREKAKVREEIGIVFQESTLDGKLTVEENIKLHCDFYQVPKNELRDRIDFVLELVDLQKWQKAPVESLSGGMKRRVEIARGLAHSPRVLFLDEPTAGLDPQTRAIIWNYIKKLQEQSGLTVFLTTHNMEEAEICQKVAIIDQGRLAAFDTPYNLKQEYTFSAMRVRTTRPAALKDYLERHNISSHSDDGMFILDSIPLEAMLQIIALFRDAITDLEINKGTLNEVFLAITGRKVRD